MEDNIYAICIIVCFLFSIELLWIGRNQWMFFFFRSSNTIIKNLDRKVQIQYDRTKNLLRYSNSKDKRNRFSLHYFSNTRSNGIFL